MSGTVSFFAISAGSSCSLRYLSEFATVRANPSMTMSLMNSTYAFQIGAPFDTLSTRFDASSSLAISFPPLSISW